MIIKNKIKDLLIGTLLGDAHIRRSGINKAYITFEQSVKNKDYLMFLYEAVNNEDLSLNEPKIENW